MSGERKKQSFREAFRQSLREALHGNAEATRQFYLAREGLVPRETFFNPEVMGALMGSVV